jgi:hypothetical protein
MDFTAIPVCNPEIIIKQRSSLIHNTEENSSSKEGKRTIDWVLHQIAIIKIYSAGQCKALSSPLSKFSSLALLAVRYLSANSAKRSDTSCHSEPCPEPFGGVYTEGIECAQDKLL